MAPGQGDPADSIEEEQLEMNHEFLISKDEILADLASESPRFYVDSRSAAAYGGNATDHFEGVR